MKRERGRPTTIFLLDEYILSARVQVHLSDAKFLICWNIERVRRGERGGVLLFIPKVDHHSLCLSVHVVIYLSVSTYVITNASIFAFIKRCVFLLFYLCICPFFSPFICTSKCASVLLPTFVPIYNSLICVCIYLPMNLSTCLCIYLLINLFMHLSIYLCIYLPLHLFIYLAVPLST